MKAGPELGLTVKWCLWPQGGHSPVRGEAVGLLGGRLVTILSNQGSGCSEAGVWGSGGWSWHFWGCIDQVSGHCRRSQPYTAPHPRCTWKHLLRGTGANPVTFPHGGDNLGPSLVLGTDLGETSRTKMVSLNIDCRWQGQALFTRGPRSPAQSRVRMAGVNMWTRADPPQPTRRGSEPFCRGGNGGSEW